VCSIWVDAVANEVQIFQWFICLAVRSVWICDSDSESYYSHLVCTEQTSPLDKRLKLHNFICCIAVVRLQDLGSKMSSDIAAWMISVRFQRYT
jgi:hypothetical protein